MGATVLAIMATSPRRWGLQSGALQGGVELSATSPESVHVFELSMPGVRNTEGGVDFTLDVTATGSRATPLHVEARFDGAPQPSPNTGPSQTVASGPARVVGFWQQRCPQGPPCTARVRVTMRRERPDATPLQVVWSATGGARGLGDDPPAGTAVTLRRVE